MWIDDAIHGNCYVNTASVIVRHLGYQAQDGADQDPTIQS